MTKPKKTTGGVSKKLEPAVAQSSRFQRTSVGRAKTLGEQLRDARERLGLVRAQCARRLNISEKYLEALEEGQYSVLPGKIYARGWLKKYTALLELSADEILGLYDRESAAVLRAAGGSTAQKEQSTVKPVWSLVTPSRLAAAGTALAVIGYLAFVLYQSIAPPRTVFDPPLQDFRTHDTTMVLAGKTDPGSTVTVNEQPINVGSDGSFSQVVPLHEGINELSIVARTKRSRSFQQTVRVIRTAPPELISDNP